MMSNRRKSLEDLIGDPQGVPEEAPQAHADPPPPPPTPDPPAPPRRRKPAAKPPARPTTAVTGPKWMRLERKEVLLRPEQLDALTELRRELNRERGRGQGERITENTLIRVAVDWLLANSDQVQGITEDELRDSVTPGVRKARRRR